MMSVMILALAAAALLPIDASWSRAAVWDDGRAEVAHYEAHRKVYGTDRAFEAVLITVKEEFNRALGVKADPPYEGKDIATVLKMNIIGRIQTENYPYSYMTSVFVSCDDPRSLVKLSQSSQEWCGTTFKEVVTWDGPPHMVFHSYFDGQADGRHPLALKDGALLEEQLFLVLRAAALKPSERYSFPLFDSLVTNSVKPPIAGPVEAVLGGEETLATPAGSFPTQRIELRGVRSPSAAAPLLTFWIENRGARALVKFSAADGRTLLLKEISRRDYWSR